MDITAREEMIKFCVEATADLNDVPVEIINREKFAEMTDEQLQLEADWLDSLLGK